MTLLPELGRLHPFIRHRAAATEQRSCRHDGHPSSRWRRHRSAAATGAGKQGFGVTPAGGGPLHLALPMAFGHQTGLNLGLDLLLDLLLNLGLGLGLDLLLDLALGDGLGQRLVQRRRRTSPGSSSTGRSNPGRRSPGWSRQGCGSCFGNRAR